MNRQIFEMQPIFMMICKNPLAKYLVLRNKETKRLRFFQDQSPIPIPLPFGAERLVNLKTGIPIKFQGILKFEYKIDKPKKFQSIMTIYYAETNSKEEIFEKWTKELFENEEFIWLKKEEILKTEGNNCIDWINYLEKGGKIYPLSYLEDENEVFNENRK